MAYAAWSAPQAQSMREVIRHYPTNLLAMQPNLCIMGLWSDTSKYSNKGEHYENYHLLGRADCNHRISV